MHSGMQVDLSACDGTCTSVALYGVCCCTLLCVVVCCCACVAVHDVVLQCMSFCASAAMRVLLRMCCCVYAVARVLVVCVLALRVLLCVLRRSVC